jgi:hypothetical protein
LPERLECLPNYELILLLAVLQSALTIAVLLTIVQTGGGHDFLADAKAERDTIPVKSYDQRTAAILTYGQTLAREKPERHQALL